MNKLTKQTASILVAIAAIGQIAVGMPARKGLITYTQPDGTEINVYAYGDERHHYYTTEDGYLLMRGSDDAFRYAVNVEGNVRASDILATNVDDRPAAVRDMLTKVDKAAQQRHLAEQSQLTRKARNPYVSPQAFRSEKGKASNAVNVAPESEMLSYPVQGSPRALVILVEYKDVSFSVASDAANDFAAMLSEEGYNVNNATGSCLDFFRYSSNGQFTPQFDIYGPVVLPNNMSYYGQNDYSGDDKRPEKIVTDAMDILDPDVDFSVYDTDNDGIIDNVYVFYAGKGENDGGSSNTIWPHAWNVYKGAGVVKYYDGVMVDPYAMSQEIDGTTRKLSGIGVFCHEFSHVLSLPDIYATNYSSSFTPDEYDLLDGGSYNNDSRTPPSMTGYERYCLGWIDPEELTEPANVTIGAISSLEGYDDVKIIKTANKNEYFVLENRQKTDWDKYIPGHGMLIWHIDYSQSAWVGNSANNNASHQRIDIEEADGRQTSSSRAGDTFPGTAKVTSFTDDTTPSMVTWKNVRMGKPITDITETKDGYIMFKFMGGVDFEQSKVGSLPATDVTENGFVANWKPTIDAISYEVEIYKGNSLDSPLYKAEANAIELETDGHNMAIDGLDADTEYLYRVCGIASNGAKSQYSDAILVKTNHSSGVANVVSATHALVTPGVGEIVLSAASTTDVAVYDIAGRVVYKGVAMQGKSKVQLDRGVYVVKIGDKVSKVAVR